MARWEWATPIVRVLVWLEAAQAFQGNGLILVRNWVSVENEMSVIAATTRPSMSHLILWQSTVSSRYYTTEQHKNG